MSISRKYGRTSHYLFSEGTTSDDRLNHDWWEDVTAIDETIDTEKMDGENSCLNDIGVFARSHAAPTRHVWSEHLKVKHGLIKNDLASEGIEIFGENMYAIHSILYPELTDHFYVFGVRKADMWLSWEEVKWYTEFFDMKTVPELGIIKPSNFTQEEFKQRILNIVKGPSTFGSYNHLGINAGEPCSMEGLVTRNINEFLATEKGGISSENVFKWVRKGHVQTDEHWTKGWKRAELNHERLAKLGE